MKKHQALVVAACAGNVLALLACPDLMAQAPRRVTAVPDRPSCAPCRIVALPGVVLDVVDDSIDSFPFAVRVDARQRFWVLAREGTPLVFDSSGRFLSVVGRKGRGPGEFTSAHDVVPLAPDSFAVFDGRLMRATILNDSLRAVRQVALPFVPLGPAIVRWPVVVGSGTHSSSDRAGWPLHLFSLSGDPTTAMRRSFGDGDGELRPDGPARTRHSLTASRSGGFWAAWMYGYRVSEFSRDGRLLRTFTRMPEWFSEPSPVSAGTPSSPPPPLLAAIQEDKAGRLWVAVRVAARDWKGAWPRIAPGTREVSSRSVAVERMYDTMLEVLDPETGSVVARQNERGYLVSMLPGPRAVFYRVDERGEGIISVVALALIER